MLFEDISLHTKVLLTKSQDALSIDFPIKCLFCLYLCNCGHFYILTSALSMCRE